jgi:hypothetical protein
MGDFTIFPLRRGTPGNWMSRDNRWAFMRHESDPSPKRFERIDMGRAA